MDMGEREGAAVGMGERERGSQRSERERGFGTKMRRVWLVRDKIVF